jgi:hypothetical protein
MGWMLQSSPPPPQHHTCLHGPWAHGLPRPPRTQTVLTFGAAGATAPLSSCTIRGQNLSRLQAEEMTRRTQPNRQHYQTCPGNANKPFLFWNGCRQSAPQEFWISLPVSSPTLRFFKSPWFSRAPSVRSLNEQIANGPKNTTDNQYAFTIKSDKVYTLQKKK